MSPKRLHDDEEIVAFSIRIPASLKRVIEQRAKLNLRSLNQEIVWLIQQALENPQSPESKGRRSSG